MKYNNEEMLYLLWLYNIEGIGKVGRNIIKEKGITPKELYNFSYESLIHLGISEKYATLIDNNKNIEEIKVYYDNLKTRDIEILYPGHPYYPLNLIHIYDAPEILYARGKIEHINDKKSIAIIGSRQPDDYGKEICKHFARKLSKQLTIVSGLARGIDSIAHKACIDDNGFTIAILGCGINVTYPPEAYNLYQDIQNHGVILSEYGLDVKPNHGYFPQRNRIISGMSEGVLVIEAKKKSGTLITSDYALEQGKQVYAIPGRITDVLSEGTNDLIKQGAMSVTNANDIIVDLGLDTINSDTKEMDILEQIEVNKKSLAPLEKIVYSCLRLSPIYLDDIVNSTNIGVSKTISILYKLEEKGLVRQTLKGFYVITA